MTTRSSTASTIGEDCALARHDDPRVERTRAAVIEAAVEILMVDGPSAITHSNVANAANVSRTTAYKHWPRRADLLRSTIEEIHRTSPPSDPLSGDLRSDLGQLFDHVSNDLSDDQRAPLMAIMMERALRDPTVKAVRDELIAEFVPVFQKIMTNAIDTGQIRRDIDLDIALASIVGSFIFIRFMSPQVLDAPMAERILDEFVAANQPR
jgi:TetR/AcrR family transcriptional regulator of autoinduction and epiphytic fitness